MKHKSILELKTHKQGLPIYNCAFPACKVRILAEEEIKRHPELHGKVLCPRKVLP